jgi:hypothetical protein
MFNFKYSMLFFLLVTRAGISVAQQKTSAASWQFHSINSVGLLEGQVGSAFQLQTINGAQYKSWFGGIGLGLDYYRYRTIPLFVDLRKEFGKAADKLFVYSDLGINFGWVTDKQKTPYMTDDKFANGFYSDLGFGYKINLKKNGGLLMSLGYTYKKVTESYKLPVYFMANSIYYEPALNEFRQQYSYSMNRITIKIGWEF